MKTGFTSTLGSIGLIAPTATMAMGRTVRWVVTPVVGSVRTRVLSVHLKRQSLWRPPVATAPHPLRSHDVAP